MQPRCPKCGSYRMTIVNGTERQSLAGAMEDGRQIKGDDSVSCEECGFEASVGDPTPVPRVANQLRETVDWLPRD
jgi:hypothetical protein